MKVFQKSFLSFLLSSSAANAGPIPSVTTLIPAPYLANASTRNGIAGAFATTNTYMMSRNAHFARGKLVNPRLPFGNFYVNASGSGDTGTGAAATITESIEYPAGTCTPETFSGASSVNVASATIIIPDPIPVTIPDGAEYWERRWYHNTAGILTLTLSANQSGTFDQVNYGTSGITDSTVSCAAVTNRSAIQVAPDLGTLVQTTRPSGCFIGDSKLAGVWDTQNDASGDTGDLARFFGPSFAYIKMGIPGDALTTTLGNTALRAQIAQWCSFVVDADGINDAINLGQTAAQIASNRTAMAAVFAPLPVYGVTLTPYTTSTDGDLTTGNQTVSSKESIRTGFNALVLAGIAGEVNVIDLNGAIDPNNTGLWPIFCSLTTGAVTSTVNSNNSPTCFSATTGTSASTHEGLHENPAGEGLIKHSTIWNGLFFGR
jgi:hypothetical protein